MEKLNQQEFVNILCILAKMDERCADRIVKSNQQSFIDVASASDYTKQYEQVCIDDLYYNYQSGRMDIPQAAEEAIIRIAKAKQVVTRKAPEPKVINIDSNHVLDILKHIMHDADDNMQQEEPKEDEKEKNPISKAAEPIIAKPSAPATLKHVVQPTRKKENPYDAMSIFEEEEEEEKRDVKNETPDRLPESASDIDKKDVMLEKKAEEENKTTPAVTIPDDDDLPNFNDYIQEEKKQPSASKRTPEEEALYALDDEEYTVDEKTDSASNDCMSASNDSVNLRSPSPSPQGLANDDEVGVQSVDGVSDSTHTSNYLETDGQRKIDRGFPPIDDDHDMTSALEVEEDIQSGNAEIPEEEDSENMMSEAEEEPQKEVPDNIPEPKSVDEVSEPFNVKELSEEEFVATDVERELKDALAKVLNFKHLDGRSEEEEAKEIFDTLVKGASKNFFAQPASIKYDVKEEEKKPVNPNGSLGDVIAAALGAPEAGSVEAEAAAKNVADKLDKMFDL